MLLSWSQRESACFGKLLPLTLSVARNACAFSQMQYHLMGWMGYLLSLCNKEHVLSVAICKLKDWLVLASCDGVSIPKTWW